MTNLEKIRKVWFGLDQVYEKKGKQYGTKLDFIKKLVAYSEKSGRCNALFLKEVAKQGIDLTDEKQLERYKELMDLISVTVYRLEHGILDGVDDLQNFVGAKKIESETTIIDEKALYQLDTVTQNHTNFVEAVAIRNFCNCSFSLEHEIYSIYLKNDDDCLTFESELDVMLWIKANIDQLNGFNKMVAAVLLRGVKSKSLKFPLTFIGKKYFDIVNGYVKVEDFDLKITPKCVVDYSATKFSNFKRNKEYIVDFKAYQFRVKSQVTTANLVFVR